ncbi:MAG: response regulator transcription factor [Halieaceae bacterium]|jgi:two-component system response regulator PhoP|nr:response regulator transcription factor [Halieaceae bacterium]
MRLLVVEDDLRLRSRLAEHFRAAGWVVDEAPDGREARFLCSEYRCDIAIVDLGLPDVSGVDLIREWRAAGLATPILILTARADWQDKVGGLEAGADDYVTKPFYLEEVEARLQALLRRVDGRRRNIADYVGRDAPDVSGAGQAAGEGEGQGIRIDFSARRVSRAGAEVELTAFEYNTLAYLAHRSGDAVSRAELLDHLYDRDSDRDSNVLEVFVGRLRRKLDPDGSLLPIETVRGVGYRFTLERRGA